MITLPKFMDLQQWADVVVLDLSQYGTFSKLLDEKDWKVWGEQFTVSTVLQGQVPHTEQFDDWQDWAERLCGALA